MGHNPVVHSTPTDPRPFVQPEDTTLTHQARCPECDWEGPVREDEHGARTDAEEHESAT